MGLLKRAMLASTVAVVAVVFVPTALATTPLEITKTATGHWSRTFEWTIEKTVTPATHDLLTGQSGTSTYTVTVTRSEEATDAYWVDGEVCVTNNGAVPTEGLAIEDRIQAVLADGDTEPVTFGMLDVSANPVLDPGESHCYAYSFPIVQNPDASYYRNVAQATITNDPREPGTPLGPTVREPFVFGEVPDVTNDAVNVVDTNGMSWLFEDSGSQSYTRTFTCDGDAGEHDNTATIVETGQSDDASVTVTCTPPSQGCTATLGYWKTHSKYGPAAPRDATWDLIGEDTLFFSSGMSWYQLFWTNPSGGNAYLILAHQYMAARLNILSGAASTSAVDAALAWATTFFSTYTPSSTLTKSVKNQAVAYADLLDDYNNGEIGPGHCN